MYDVYPPMFPEFIWEEFFWVTSAKLDSWDGFQIREGPYGAISGDGMSDGLVHIVLIDDERDEGSVTEQELIPIKWVIKNEKNIHDSFINKLLEDYSNIREEVLGWASEDEANELLPPLDSIKEIKKLCGVVNINVYPHNKLSKPLIGVELGCTWEEEHGAGVVLHGDRVLKRGVADTAIFLRDAVELVIKTKEA